MGFRFPAIALLCAMLALAPSLAEAAAGNSRSFGSRGSAGWGQSYSAPRPARPSYQPSPSYRAPITRPGPVSPAFGGVHPFWSGVLGGFVGGGLAGMLFSGGAYPVAVSPGAATLGILLQLALFGGLLWWGMRLFRRY